MGKAHHPPSTSMYSSTQKLCQPSPFWGFMVPSLHRQVWFNHWPLATELSLQPLSPPWSSSHLITGWLPWQPTPHAPHSKAPPQSHLIKITKDIFLDLSIGNSKNFRSSMIRKGMKTKYKFIINHNVRVILCNFQIKHFKDMSPWHPENTVYIFCFHCSLMVGLIWEEYSRYFGTTDIWSDDLSCAWRMSSLYLLNCPSPCPICNNQKCPLGGKVSFREEPLLGIVKLLHWKDRKCGP